MCIFVCVMCIWFVFLLGCFDCFKISDCDFHSAVLMCIFFVQYYCYCDYLHVHVLHVCSYCGLIHCEHTLVNQMD